MDDISLPHDARVEDILADYFTKKIEGKDTESKGKASDSQHSSKSKKSKKRKHKKKKKHKSRKAHSESDQEEKHSSDDECWVEVTAKRGDSHTKGGGDTQPQGKSDAQDQKQPGMNGAAGTAETPSGKVSESPPSSPAKESAAFKERSHPSTTSADSEGSPRKNINGELVEESNTKTSLSKDTIEDPPKKMDGSVVSDKDEKNSKASADVDDPSDDESSPKKQGKKKRRSYRTKRCRSSGSSSEDPDETEEKTKEDTRRSPSRKSTQKDDRSRARRDSRSRRNSSRERRERSVSRSRTRQQRRSSNEARDRKRSRASRSPSRRRSRNSRSRSRDRRLPSRRSRSPKQTIRRSHSPKRSNRRSRSPRQSRDGPSRRRSSSRHSRSRNLLKRSRSRSHNRSYTTKQSRSSRSRSRSQRRSRRSRSGSRRRARRSNSQKRSSSGRRSDLKHSRSRSSSRERAASKSREKRTARKSTDRRSSSNERKALGRDGPSEKNEIVDSSSLNTTTVPDSNEQADSKTDDKTSSSKNQVVLYGPFEEEDATFLDEESSPDRAMPTGVAKPPAAEETTVKPAMNDPENVQEGGPLPASSGKSIPTVALENIKYPDPETILLPGESPRSDDDTKPTRCVVDTCETAVEDMDISNSPLSGGMLEVEETFSSSYGAVECLYQPPGISRSFYDGRGTVQDAQVATSGLLTELHSGEAPVKPEGLWGFSDSRPQQRVKIDLNKPVGQVKPILREKNIFETLEAPKENVLQAKLEDRSPARAQFHNVALGPVAEQRAPLPSGAAIEAQTVYVLETAMEEAKSTKASPIRPYPVSGEATRASRVSGAGCFSAVPLQYDEPKQRDSENELPPEQAVLPAAAGVHPVAQSQIQDRPVQTAIGNRSSSGGEQPEKISTSSRRPGKVTSGETAMEEALHQGPSVVATIGDGTGPQDNKVSMFETSEPTKAAADLGNNEAQELSSTSMPSLGDVILSSTKDLAVDVSGSSSKTSILNDKDGGQSLSKSKDESRSPSPSHNKSPSPSRGKSRSRSKDRRSRSQSKEKSRSLSKDGRSRSRDRKSHSRSEDRKSRSRSRGKKRSRKERSTSKEKQRSKRSRSRQRRSRSRHRSRSQSRDRKRPRRSSSRGRRRSSRNRSGSRGRQRSPRRRSASKSPRRSRSKQRQKSRRGHSKGRDKSSKKRSRSREKKKSRKSRSKERKSSKKGKHGKEKSSKKKSSRCKESSSPDCKAEQKSDTESTPQKSDNLPDPAEEKPHDNGKADSVKIFNESVKDVEMNSEEYTVLPQQGTITRGEDSPLEQGKHSDLVSDSVTTELQPEVSSVEATELPAESSQKHDPMAQLDGVIERQSASDLGSSSQQTDLAISTGQHLDHSATVTNIAPDLEEIPTLSKSDPIETKTEIIDKTLDEKEVPPSESFTDAKQVSNDKSPVAEREESFAQVNIDREELASTDVSQVEEAPSSKDLDQDRPRQGDSSPIKPHGEGGTTSKPRSCSSSMSRSPSPSRSKDGADSRSRKRSPTPEKRKRQRSKSVSPKRRSRSREKKKSHSPERRSRSREKKRSRSREKKRSRSREKKRSRSREKKRSRSREKKRSRSREKKRSRSREKRSRSREKKRSRSREKKRSRSRDKRSRSRDKKRSRSREKKRSKSREKKRSRSRDKKRSRSRDKKRSRSRDKRRSRSRDKKRSRSREKRRSRERKNSRSRSRDKKRSRSRERRKSRSRDRNRSRSRDRKRSRSRVRSPIRRKSRSRERLRRRSLSRRRSPIRKKSRSRSRRRSRSRSSERRRLRKSRSREREPSVVKVDKAQLLEAARKNMQAMLQRGVVAKGLPVAAAAAVNATVKVVAAAVAAAAADPSSSLAATLAVSSTPPSTSMAPAAMPVTMAEAAAAAALPSARTSSEEQPKVKKSLAALTDICKAISEEEKREYAGEVEPKTADEVAQEFHETHHHPFKLKDPPPPIRFNIPNATNLPIKTLAEKVADAAHLHKQFPVSSGNQHRIKELEWVPVEKPDPSPPAAPKSKGGKSAGARDDPDAVGIAKSPPRPLPALPPPPALNTFSPLPTIATPPVFQVQPERQTVSVAVVPPTPKAVEAPAGTMSGDTNDLADIMKRRVEALKALKENPMDLEAMKVYHNCHKQFQAWALSKHEPGQYTGSIDFKPLTPDELSGPNPAWVKKDQFVRAAPVCEGIGMHLLRKMGWAPGEGLGKNKEGCLEPLLPSIKTDKKGLVSDLELRRSAAPAHHDLGGKHPVSALTEMCIKARWGPPEFVLVNESGPDHKKMFLFKVKVNGMEFQPAERSANKKHAKAQAAMLCLQETGIIGKCSPTGSFTSSGAQLSSVPQSFL
ncbi:serine/arginine repetitive matrix protein 2 isoform X1 [Ixodes scapularis]